MVALNSWGYLLSIKHLVMIEDTTNSAPSGSAAPSVQEAETQEARVASTTEKEGKETRIYEVGYLLLPTISEEELPREVTAIKDILDKEGVTLIREEFPKFRALSYAMQKRVQGAYVTHTNAYFGWIKFEAAALSARRIEQALQHYDKLLRFLLIKTVREETMNVPRLPRTARGERKEAPKGAPASAPVSETELDKSLEKLIAE